MERDLLVDCFVTFLKAIRRIYRDFQVTLALNQQKSHIRNIYDW